MLLRTALTSLIVLAAAMPAFAGECPADKLTTDPGKPTGTAAKGVSDTVLSMIDLSKEKVMIGGHMMRLRRLEVQPGGVVPWHSHAERPALIYVVSGQIVEHAGSCAVPIVHKAGEVARETHATSHWWQNPGTASVVLLSFDIAADPHDHDM